MSMTVKQIKKRMDEAWESHFKQYDTEAEWYGNEEPKLWVCDIPSQHITVKLELNEELKEVAIYVTDLQAQSDYRRIRETDWQMVDSYRW